MRTRPPLARQAFRLPRLLVDSDLRLHPQPVEPGVYVRLADVLALLDEPPPPRGV